MCVCGSVLDVGRVKSESVGVGVGMGVCACVGVVGWPWRRGRSSHLAEVAGVLTLGTTCSTLAYQRRK